MYVNMLDLIKQPKYFRELLFPALVILFSIPQASYAGRPDFPAPPKAAVEWVGQNIEVNGIKQSIRAFHSNESIEDVVKFYRKEWKRPIAKDKPGFMESIDAAPWYIISRIEKGYLMTVQVQIQKNDESSSWGYLSMSHLPDADPSDEAPQLGKTVPRIPGSIVMSELKSDDPGKKATTVIISNTHSVRNNADFYRSHYLNKGWTMETDKNLGRSEAHSLVFKTRTNRITIMLLEDKDYTRIVVNSVSNSIF
jgi:hypothetical protein